MEEQVLQLPHQFSWEPKIEQPRDERTFEKTIVCGMGGSHLAARLLMRHRPELDLVIHSDYGLPPLSPEQRGKTLVIASSYSGDTEETVDAAHTAIDQGIPLVVMTKGGALATLAREHECPLILFPDTGIEPRAAMGYSLLAMAHFLQDTVLEAEIRQTGAAIDPEADRMLAESLAATLTGRMPVVYSSTQNSILAYFWKIAFNESAKVPAAYNIFPELCHNELSGFDVVEATKNLSTALHIVLLEDPDDHPRIQERMKLVTELLAARGIGVTSFRLPGSTPLEKGLRSLVVGLLTAVTLARTYGVPDAKTPLIAEFKNRMAQL